MVILLDKILDRQNMYQVLKEYVQIKEQVT